MHSWKKWLMAIGAALGVTGGVLAMIPATSPFAPVVQEAGRQVSKHAEGMRDDCGALCGYDALTGKNSYSGVLVQLDGGSCDCR